MFIGINYIIYYSLNSFRKPKFVTENKTMVMVPLIITSKNERKAFVGVGENKSQAKLAAAKMALRHYFLDPILNSS